MRRVETRYVPSDQAREERTRRIVALLGAALTRMLKKGDGPAVDFSPDLSVTTDYEKEDP